MIEKNIHKIVIGDTSYKIVDKSVPKWAKEKTKPSYTPEEVNAMGFPSYIYNEHDLTVNDFSKSGWCFIGNVIRPFDNYLTIEALENDLTVSFSLNTIQYSTDNCQTWNELPANTKTPAINTGDMISFKATGLVPNSYNGIGTFTVNKKFNLKGNVMSMLFGDEGKNSFDLTGYNYAFSRLFRYCYTLQSVSKDFLPATTLADLCYYGMFNECESLVTTPELPATTLADYCYYNMFGGCKSLVTAPELPATTLKLYCYYRIFAYTSLVTAPELPATTLAEGCYRQMFEGCTSLVTAPELPVTTLAGYCYTSMFLYCTSLVTAPVLPATTLAEGCYFGMFEGTNILPDCTNIDFTSESVVTIGGLAGLFAGTNVTDEDLYDILPINPSTGKYWLPVTTLTDNCYEYMFQNCSSLITAPELPATTLANSCYYYMFDNCTSLVTAPELPATTLTDSCYSGMFSGCTSLVTAPELPATILANNCYSYMFQRCGKLNRIKALFTTEPSSTYTSGWVFGVSSTGTFVKNVNATWNVTGNNGIPNGWSVELDIIQDQDISFTVEGTQYYADSGMTWEEWLNSEYNTAGWGTHSQYNTYITFGNGPILGGVPVLHHNQTIVETGDTIIDGAEYYFTQGWS